MSSLPSTQGHARRMALLFECGPACGRLCGPPCVGVQGALSGDQPATAGLAMGVMRWDVCSAVLILPVWPWATAAAGAGPGVLTPSRHDAMSTANRCWALLLRVLTENRRMFWHLGCSGAFLDPTPGARCHDHWVRRHTL